MTDQSKQEPQKENAEETTDSLPLTSLALIEAFAKNPPQKAGLIEPCFPPSSHTFTYAESSKDLPKGNKTTCWHCDKVATAKVKGKTTQLGSCGCGVTLCQECWERLTEECFMMVEMGELTDILINGAAEVRWRDREFPASEEGSSKWEEKEKKQEQKQELTKTEVEEENDERETEEAPRKTATTKRKTRSEAKKEGEEEIAKGRVLRSATKKSDYGK